MPRFEVDLTERQVLVHTHQLAVDAASPEAAGAMVLAGVETRTNHNGEREWALPDGRSGVLAPDDVEYNEVTVDVRDAARDRVVSRTGYRSIIALDETERAHVIAILTWASNRTRSAVRLQACRSLADQLAAATP